MQMIKKAENSIEFSFTKEEFNLLRAVAANIIEDALMGDEYDIESRTGFNLQKAENFSDEILSKYNKISQHYVSHVFSLQETKFLIVAIQDTADIIAEDFSVILGFSIEEASTLRESLFEAVT